MRRVLKKVPGVSSAYHQTRMLAGLIYEGWLVNRGRYFDRLLAAGASRAGLSSPADAAEGRLWDFETGYNAERYQRALAATGAALEGEPWGDALELGCGTGVFTALLAERCRRVVAVDISSYGCEQTRIRCAGTSNVVVHPLDLRKDPIGGLFDLVFAMDVLEYFHGRSATGSVVKQLADVIRYGGLLVTTVTRLPEEMRDSWWARKLVEGGDAIAAFLDGKHGLRLIRRDLYPKYLVAVFEKSG